MLFLDQGYWPDAGLTPPSSEALIKDIEMAKALRFNGCRKHQKVEDSRFHYWADRVGWLVWGEMGNAYEFGHEFVDRMNGEWTEAVKRDINYPCVITWTPVNESSTLGVYLAENYNIYHLETFTYHDDFDNIFLIQKT